VAIFFEMEKAYDYLVIWHFKNSSPVEFKGQFPLVFETFSWPVFSLSALVMFYLCDILKKLECHRDLFYS
jgi:hypothetical protein